MELQNLRLFVMCAKHLSFSRVAELAYMSQPSVSKCISALEAEIGGELFVRSSRKMQMTSLGEGLLPYAESLLAKEDELRGFLHQRRTGQDIRPLVVGVSTLLAASPPEALLQPLVNAVESFQQLQEETKVKIRFLEEDKLRELLAAGRVDLAVTAINNNHFAEQLSQGYDYMRLDETENFLLYSPSLGEFSSCEQLLPHLDCLLSVSDQMAMSVTYEFLRKTKAPLRVEPCDNWSEVVIKVKNGQGAAILGASTAKVAIKCGLGYVPLTDMGISTSLIAVWKGRGDDKIKEFAYVFRSWYSDATNFS